MADDSVKAENDLLSKEEKTRNGARHNLLWLFLVNGYSSIAVFVTHLISLEGVLSICISVALTVYLHESTGDSFSGDTLDWVLLSFAVITPISAAISMSFSRRENALAQMASYRASCLALYQSHALWGWNWKVNSSGRPDAVNSLEHSDQVLCKLLNISIYMARYLTLPNCTRARHKTTAFGRKEAKEVFGVAADLVVEIERELYALGTLCEFLKSHGLPGNEAARMRQWERFLSENFERLRVVKRYRTPQGLRSFGRLFSFFLPPFYAPYYADLARNLNSLAVGIMFAALTSIALTSLFETVSQMEDPFIETSLLDSIQVKQGRSHIAKPKETCSSHGILGLPNFGAEPSNLSCLRKEICAAAISKVRIFEGRSRWMQTKFSFRCRKLFLCLTAILVGSATGTHHDCVWISRSCRGGSSQGHIQSNSNNFHLISVLQVQDSAKLSSSWLLPGCTILSSQSSMSPTSAWNCGNEALVKALALVSDVVVLSVSSDKDALQSTTMNALQQGWQRRLSQGLPPGRLWIVWTGAKLHDAKHWLENMALQDSINDLPVADWQICEGPEAYERAVSELGLPTTPLVPAEGLPSLLQAAYLSLGGQGSPLFAQNTKMRSDNPIKNLTNDSVPNDSNYLTESHEQENLDTTPFIEDDESISAMELGSVQTMLDDYWLNDSGTGLAPPPDLVKELPSKLPETDEVLSLLEQHAQVLRDYYGRLYESLLESGRCIASQTEQSLSKQYQSAALRVAKHVGLSQTQAYEQQYHGLQSDFEEINDRWTSTSKVLMEEEDMDEASRSDGARMARRQLPRWLRRLAVRVVVLSVNYLQGWLAWQAVRRAALERERAMPKFPLF